MLFILNENFFLLVDSGELLRMERLIGIHSSFRVSFENSHTMPVVNLNGFDSSFSGCFVSCTVPVHYPSFRVLGCGVDCSNYMQSSQRLQ